MAATADAVIPRFFNTPYSVLTTIGLNNVLLGFMVAGISGKFSILVLVPMVNSVAVCLVNGLWYYTYTANYAAVNQAIACSFMNLAFLVSAFWTIYLDLGCFSRSYGALLKEHVLSTPRSSLNHGFLHGATQNIRDNIL